MALVLLIAIGAVTGWLGSILTRREERGAILRFIAIGTGGAVVAGLIANHGNILGGLRLWAVLAAMAGAGALLAAWHLVQIRKSQG